MDIKMTKKHFLVLFFFVGILIQVSLSGLDINEKIEGKRLQHGNVKLLEAAFWQYPVGLLKIRYAEQKLEQVQKKIKSHFDAKGGIIASISEKFSQLTVSEAKKKEKDINEEKEFVQAQLKDLLGSIEPFFKTIIEYQSIIEPLMAESLKIRSIQFENSFFINFTASKMDIKTFCENKIVTIQSLENTCQELRSFIADLNMSLSDQIKKNIDDIVQKSKKKSK